MKIKKISFTLITLFLFVLSFSFVNANAYWSQEANANYDLGLGVTGIAYGSNFNNVVENITGNDYTLCSITKSDYTPIATDFGQTGTLKVVVTDKSTNKLSIYYPDCSLFAEINVNGTITAMPVLLKPKSYFDQQIVVLTSTHLKSYMYDMDLGYFVEETSISYQGHTTNAKYLTCLDEYTDSTRNEKCFAVYWIGSLSDIMQFDMVNKTFTYEYYELHNPTYLTEYLRYNGLSNFRNPIDDYDFYIPFGFYKTYGAEFYGNLLDGDANYLAEYNGDYNTIAVDYYYDSPHFIAKIGNNYRIFSLNFVENADYISSNHYHHQIIQEVYINDLSGNILFFSSTIEDAGSSITGSAFAGDNISYKRFSNWAVADYDKDGMNEACFLIKNDDEEIWLQCYESTLSQSNGDIRVNYTGLMDNISNIVLADFIASKNVLGVATKEGIFYPDDKVFSTGKIADFGYPITVIKDVYSKIPIYIYADDDEGFIVYSNISIDSCGNGDCEYWETPLSCYEDCFQLPPDEDLEGEFREGSPCEFNEDCREGLECIYRVCIKAGFNRECISDNTCISGSCVNGKCSKPTLWQNVEASKGEMFGDDVHTNNFLSLLIMIVVSGLIGYYMVFWAGIATLFMLAIFFMLAGWLSPFIIMGLFIVGAIALVFGLIIGAQSH